MPFLNTSEVGVAVRGRVVCRRHTKEHPYWGSKQLVPPKNGAAGLLWRKQTMTSTPTARQLAYLRYLAGRAHPAGIPYLPIEELDRNEAAAWIDHLLFVVRVHDHIEQTLAKPREQREDEAPASSPYLITPPGSRAPDGYRPPYQDVPTAFDHEHAIDTYRTEDVHEVVYCTRCGGGW